MLKRLSGALLALIAAFALAQDADAKPRTYKLPGGRSLEFHVHGTSGYKLDVTSDGPAVTVVADNRRRGTAVSYTVRRRARSDKGFEAKLPGVGRIAGEFHPIGRARKVRDSFADCTGRPARIQAGVFLGTIEFHGERGYTEVRATRAKGMVTRTYPQTCETAGNGGGEGFGPLKITQLTAMTTHGRLFFSASRVELKDETGLPPLLSHTAMQFSRSHGMGVLRVAFDDGREDSFSAKHTGRTAEATVKPSSPFAGTGSFAIEPDGSVAWTGDLSVTFPGTEPVSLTGKRFESQLCLGRRCAGDRLNAASAYAVVGRPAIPSSAAPTPRLWSR